MNRALIDPFPKELERAETAWAYLRRRFPEYFQGVGKMPGEVDQPVTAMVSNPQIEHDVITVAKHFLKDLKLADISEALTGSRLYAGSSLVKRLQAVQMALKDTTTTPENGQEADFGAIIAA